MRNKIDLFIQKLQLLGINISSQQIEQFVMFYKMMIDKNKVMNLTSVTEPEEVIDKHFIDSLALKRVYDLNRNISIIDVGTGAGFPGIPLKIIFPDIQIVLLDSLNKRIKFLNEVVDTLDLKGVRCIHERSEDAARDKKYRESFDLCVSRAVANLSTLSELCIPFIKVGGSFISYKAGNSKQEIEEADGAVKKLGGRIKNITEFVLPDTEFDRVFVEIEKIKNTAGKYPRKAGMPSKQPLK